MGGGKEKRREEKRREEKQDVNLNVSVIDKSNQFRAAFAGLADNQQSFCAWPEKGLVYKGDIWRCFSLPSLYILLGELLRYPVGSSPTHPHNLPF